MGRLFFLAALASVSVVSLARPWIGVVCAYLIAILVPQAVWFWNFDGLRPAMWVLLPTFVGFAVALVRGGYSAAVIANRRTIFALVLWLCYNLSYYFGPYTDAAGPFRFTNPGWAHSTLNKIFVLYFLGVICIDTEQKLKALAGVIVISAIYLTYWANDRYLSGLVIGRMAGPVDAFGASVYSDENNFAMLFVVALPFLWYLGYAFQNRMIRWGMWLMVPLGWHAIFLTASRGGLVGIAATTLLIAWRSKNKAFGFLLIPALVVAYFWQAGDLMRARADTIGEFRTETSASTRLEAWQTASRMIADHPLTGVGLASFGPAFPDYSGYQPREAHNTFFQIAAESGILAGLSYLLLVASCILALWRNGNRLRDQVVDGRPDFQYLVNEAILVAFSGLFICSLFLSLQMFEIFWYLALMTNAVLFLRQAPRSLAATGSPAAKSHLLYGDRPGDRRQP